MKHQALLFGALVTVVGMLLAGCGAPRPPVDSARDLQEVVEVGQTLDQVLDLMREDLRQRVTIYPAETIEKKQTGNWSFRAMESGEIGDTDAPYVALVVKPDPDHNKYFAVFFKEGKVIAGEWFVPAAAAVIHNVLGNLLDLGGEQESE